MTRAERHLKKCKVVTLRVIGRYAALAKKEKEKLFNIEGLEQGKISTEWITTQKEVMLYYHLQDVFERLMKDLNKL